MTKLKELRYDAGLSIREVSEKTGVARETIRVLEESGALPSAPVAFKLAPLFDMKSSELLRLLAADESDPVAA